VQQGFDSQVSPLRGESSTGILKPPAQPAVVYFRPLAPGIGVVRLAPFEDIPLRTEHFEKAAEFCNTCRRKGVQGSTIDFLISAVPIWKISLNSPRMRILKILKSLEESGFDAAHPALRRCGLPVLGWCRLSGFWAGAAYPVLRRA